MMSLFGLAAGAQTDPGQGWGEPPPEVVNPPEEGGEPEEETPPDEPPPEEEAPPTEGQGEEQGWGEPPPEVAPTQEEQRPPPPEQQPTPPTPEEQYPPDVEPPDEQPETGTSGLGPGELPELEEPEEPAIDHQFGFGSYGRVGVGTDFEGSTPRPITVVSHAPRIVETPYLEMDFYYTMDARGPYTIRTVTTLGFTEDLFHYTGDWSSMLALRNLYAEFEYAGLVSIWAGSRSYRGDDIFLLDFWPLDNLNTVGAGIAARPGRFDLSFHMGANRLRDDFTYQEIDVPARLFGSQRVVLMDRQRLITSLGGSYRVFGPPEGPAIKLKVYFEFHYLASGSYRREDQTDELLPSDFGWTGGFQLGAWGYGERASHTNFFLRYSQGLAAFGEMGIPFGVDSEKQSFPRASELLLGLATNYERGRFGILGASYLRRFVDADPSVYDEDDGWELVLDVRPWIVLWGPLQLALDLSYQQRFPTGYSPTALEVLNPAVFQLAPMLIFAPLGPGSYERPHIRLVYRYAFLNEGALDSYALEDPRRYDEHVHYFGVQVEWWYNSSYR